MNKRLLLLIAVLVFVTLACDIGGIGAQATETPPPPPTEAPPPPPTVEEPVAEPGTTGETHVVEESSGYFVDEFDGDLEDWEHFVIVGNPDGKYIRQVGGDRVKFELPKQDTSVYYDKTGFVMEDVLVETEVETVGGDDNGIMLFCRRSDKGWYEMRVHTVGRFAGTYEAYRFDPKLRSRNQNPYVNLLKDIERISTYELKSGFQVNKIGLLCQEDEIRIMINGVEELPLNRKTDIIRDSTLKEGTVGLGVMSMGWGPVNIEFESISASQP